MNARTFFSDRPVAYHPIIAKICGSVTAALFLSQIAYWNDKGFDPDGWIYKTESQMEEETGMSRKEQETARKRLVWCGILKEERRGIPAKMWYLIDWDAFNTLLDEFEKTRFANKLCESGNQDVPNGQSSSSDQANSTESTSQTTSDIVGETPNASELPSEDEIIAQDEQSPESDALAAWNALQSASQTPTDLGVVDEALILLCDTDKLLTRTRFKKDHKSKLSELLECDPTREALDNAREAFRKAIIEGKAFSAPSVFLGYYATAVDTLRIRSPMYDPKTQEFYRPVPQQAVYANDGVDF